jgi:hypothetical protein
MTAPRAWPLTRGAVLHFCERDDGLFDVEHQTEGGASFIASGLPLTAAEKASEDWLRLTRYRRLTLIEGGLR